MKWAALWVIPAAAMACSWDYAIWIQRSKTADPRYRFVRGDKAGYIDQNGRTVIPPSLDAYGNGGSEFHDGLLEVRVSDGVYVDRSGQIALNPGFYRGWDFSEGLAVAKRKYDEPFGYINTKGEFVISPRFRSAPNNYVWSFSEGLARIKVHGKYGFIDRTGNFVIQPSLPDAIEFSDERARVVMEGPCVYYPEGGCGFANPQFVDAARGTNSPPCKFTYIDKIGRLITELRFDAARNFSEGLAPVRMGEKWGFVDKAGNIGISPRFEDAQPFSSGLARIQEGKLYGYTDRSGTIVIKPQFAYAEDFSHGLAVVGEGNGYEGRHWYVNSAGKRAFEGEYWRASPFFKGLAHVQRLNSNPNQFAYIDTKGREVFRYTR
jgi:hypothetical protein